MKVVAVTPLYPPESRVGAWLATHRFLAHLVTRGHQVHVWRYLANSAPGYELDGVIVVDKLTPDLTEDCDVMVSHLGDSQQSKPIAERHGTPLVRMVHGHVEHGAHKLAGDALAVFNSEATRSAVAWDGPSVVCHPPVNPADYRTAPGDHVTLVNLCPEKGGELLPLIAKTMPDIPFLGVMGGYGRQHRRSVQNLTIRKPTANMVADVYSQTQIILMPSERETWGMVAVEAMASGIPVIAHPTAGLRECLGPAGIFADRSDLGAWVAEIRRLQDPTEWAASSAAATARAAELDPTASLDRFADSIEQLVGVTA